MAFLDGGPSPLGSDAEDATPPPNRARLEDEVAAAWAEAVGVAPVSPDDDLLGRVGDPAAADRVAARLSRRFAVRLAPRDLAAAGTPAGLAAVVARRAARAAARPPVVPAPGPRLRFPATGAQRRLWVLDKILPNPEVYNVCHLVRMTGELDVAALRAAFDRLDARQEALRVHFETDDGLPVQVVGEPRSVCLPVLDLTHLPAADREAEAVRQATEDAGERFTLSGERLWRVKLFRTDDAEHYLWLNLHHTIVDGWSVGVIFHDLEAFYDARAGTGPDLPPLAVQYGDYAVWEQTFRQSAGHKAQLDYWTRALAEPRPALDLPYAKPRPKWQTFKGSRIRFEVQDHLVRAIDRLCRDAAATRFMVGLAALQTVLHRSTGLGTLLLGTPVANRGAAGVEPLVGLFVNTLVLRTDVRGEWTFRDLLDRVRETRAGAFANQDVSLEAVIEAVRPPRDPSRQPLFQAAYYYQNVTIVPDRFSRLRLERVPVHNGTAMFDFRLVLEDGPGGGLWGWAEYNTDLLEAVHVQNLVGQVLTVLEAATATPARPIATLPLLPPSEHRRIVYDWNRTAAEYPAADRLADAFARRAAARPGAVALVAGGKTVTYGQLNERANRLAHYLRGRGVGPGDLVAVCLKRTPDMVAAVLAVCKAGAAYVPLDPGYPRERLAFMLEDTDARLVLSQWALLDRLPPTDRLVNVEQIEAELATRPAAEPDRVGTPDDVAYVIYTSGSTGKPKGVVVRH
ncbi:MAG TPA: condensation domain-containing protein, partial [Gemmataceae bacterium]|nr:condensation domain-containing protein [Gemmataceae bacterium]